MKKVQYTTRIQAPAMKVYNTMLGLDDIKSYERWTAAFNPTSTYEGSWNKGSKMRFIGVEEDGSKAGMLSEIRENTPGKFVSIRHYGMLKNDQEITQGPEVEKWAGGLEEYTFEEKGNGTELKVELDITEEYQDYFDKAWPQALDKLNELVMDEHSET